MTDEGLVAKKLAFVETCIHEIRTLALQACQDVASHIRLDDLLAFAAAVRARLGTITEP